MKTSKIIFILLYIIGGLHAQTPPKYFTNVISGVSSDAIHTDSTTVSTFINLKTNPNLLQKLFSFNASVNQGNYNILGISDSVREMKYYNNKLIVCYPTRIIAYQDQPSPVVAWTYSASSLNPISTSLSGASKRFVAMDLRNDSLFVLYNDNTIRAISISANTGAFNNYIDAYFTPPFILTNTMTCQNEVRMKVFGDEIFVFGNVQDDNNTYGKKLFSINISNGTLTHNYPLFYSNTFQNTGFVHDLEFYNGKIYTGGSFRQVDGMTRKGFAVFDTGFNLQNKTVDFGTFDFSTELQGVRRMRIYGNMLLTLGVYHSINNNPISSSVTPVVNLSAYNLNSNSIVSNTLQSTYAVCHKMLMDVSNLYLYTASHPNTSSTICQLFHLPPKTDGNHILFPGENSISSNSYIAICAPDNGSITFTAPIQFHSDIGNPLSLQTNTWTYSGSNAIIAPGPFGKTAKLILSSNATSGILSVMGRNSGNQLSETSSLNVQVYNKPTITAAFLNTDTMTCKYPKIAFNYTVNPVSAITPTWTCPDNSFKYNPQDSTNQFLSGYYKLSVIGSNGCLVKDSIYAFLDTIRPLLTLPSSQVYIKCSPDSSLLQGSTSTSLTTIWWRNAINTTIYNQPFYVKSIGNYYLVGRNEKNACRDSLLYQVLDNTILPNSKIVSHNYINPTTPIDTITCSQPSISINGDSDTANVNIYWRNINNSIFSGNPVNITNQSNLKLYVERNDNGCIDSSLIVFVKQDNSLPDISINQSQTELNCSIYQITLSATSQNTNTSITWTGPVSNTLSNQSSVSLPGKYYLSVVDSINGCSKSDSLNILLTNNIVVDAGNTKLACSNTTVSFSASSIGTLTGITYSWNTGQNTKDIITSNPVSKWYYVYASHTNGCNGRDSVWLKIPEPIQDSIVAFQNCDNSNTGSIKVFVKGGISPYQFSYDNGNSYSSNNLLSNVSFSNYTNYIKDSLQCQKTSTVSLNGNSNLPQPDFIASTFNQNRDSIVLVSISQPAPDSVQWELPIGFQIIGGDMFSPIIYGTDTGSFVIKMKSYYGTCILETNKLIKFTASDSLIATPFNQNGIKTIKLYPNPNTGEFTVEVEFHKKQNASIQIWNTNAVKQFQQNYINTNLINQFINVSHLQNGSYILRIAGEYDGRNLTFIISK